MTKNSSATMTRRLHPLTLSIMLGTLLPCALVSTPALARTAHMSHLPSRTIEIEDTVHIVGLGTLGENSSGNASFSPEAITLRTGKSNAVIPLDAVRAFSIEHSNRTLLRGPAGSILGFAPKGMGQIYRAIRPGAETLTILYTDENEALHTAVMVVPKDRKDDVFEAMGRTNLPSDPTLGGFHRTTPIAINGLYAAQRNSTFHTARPAVQLLMPRSSAEEMPSAFLAGIYEETIQELQKSGAFSVVWRDGDVRADPGTMTLTMNVTSVRKGSAGVRGGLPVVGMFAGKTLIRADIRLTDPAGTVLLEREFKGSKRLPGENMKATETLARRVSAKL